MNRIKLIVAGIAVITFFIVIGYVAALRSDLKQTELERDQFKKAAQTSINYIGRYEAERKAYETKTQELLSMVEALPEDKCPVPVGVRTIIGKL